jgi:hypothetical protein
MSAKHGIEEGSWICRGNFNTNLTLPLHFSRHLLADTTIFLNIGFLTIIVLRGALRSEVFGEGVGVHVR